MHGMVTIMDYASEEAEVPTYKFECNASWVTIYRHGVAVFSRQPKNDNWYDAKHKAIVDAMRALDAAVMAAVR